MNVSTRVLRIFLAAAAIVAMPAMAQDAFPSRPIKLVIPFPPGGTTDIVGRFVAQQMSEQLGQPIVIDNRAGASGDIGAKAVAGAAPDGYTLLFAPMGTVVINPALSKDKPLNATKDLTPIARVADAAVVVVVNATTPANTLSEFIALAKAKPGTLNYGSPGSGTAPHLAAEMFKSSAQVNIVHVPYKGGGPALAGLLGGDVAVLFTFIPSSLGNLKAGKLRPLAVASAKRTSTFPDIPTTAEAGLPGYLMTEWYALFGPAGMPPQIVRQLNEATNRALAKPEVVKFMSETGIDAGNGSAEQFAALVAAEQAKYTKAVADTGLKVD